MATTQETVSSPRRSPDKPPSVCGRCGYERTGLDVDVSCPECGTLDFEPEGLLGKVRYEWRLASSWTIKTNWVMACMSMAASALVTGGLLLVVALRVIGIDGGWDFLLPVLGWIFVVMPLALLTAFGALMTVGSGHRRITRYSALLALVAAVLPILTILVFVFLRLENR